MLFSKQNPGAMVKDLTALKFLHIQRRVANQENVENGGNCNSPYGWTAEGSGEEEYVILGS